MAVSDNTGNPIYFNEQGLDNTDPKMTGKQIIDLKFTSYVLNKYMGG